MNVDHIAHRFTSAPQYRLGYIYGTGYMLQRMVLGCQHRPELCRCLVKTVSEGSDLVQEDEKKTTPLRLQGHREKV